MQRKFRNEILLGLFFFLVISLLFYMYHAIGGRSMDEQVDLYATFDSASGLVKDNYVMIAGVPIGYVKDINVDFDKAKVWMKVLKSAEIRTDAKAAIRAKSLLGEKFIELIPASKDAPLLANGASIANTTTPMEIDEVFTTLRPFFEKLDPMAPKIEGILTELEQLLARLNKTGENKQETIEHIIDNTDRLLEESNKLLAKNEGAIGRSLDNIESLTNTAKRDAPKLLKRADKALKSIERVVAAIPVETFEKIPETFDKVDQILSKMLPLVDRMDKSGKRVERILLNLDLLLLRVSKIDELAVRKFLQQEGININLTQDAQSKKRIKELEDKQKSKD